MEWISVEDELPKYNGMYLCHFSDGVIETFLYEVDSLDEVIWGTYNDIVIHWMPLPEPPS